MRRRQRAERGGEAAADEALFESLYPTLRRFAAAVGRRGEDPDDLVQEALAKTLAKGSLAELVDPGRYLRLVMVRLASNEKRRSARAERAHARLAARPVEDTSAGLVAAQLEVLEALAPRERAVLLLAVVEGWDAAAVGEVVGMSPGAVRTAKSRALAKLRIDIEEGVCDG